MSKLGDEVKVMYPYDAGWWETIGVIVEAEDDPHYKVQRNDGEIIFIHKEYLTNE